MSTTLARRTRRIGLLPTTFKTVPYTVQVTDEDGNAFEEKRTKKVPIRHHETLTPEAIAQQTEAIKADAIVKRAAYRQRMKEQRKIHKKNVASFTKKK